MMFSAGGSPSCCGFNLTEVDDAADTTEELPPAAFVPFSILAAGLSAKQDEATGGGKIASVQAFLCFCSLWECAKLPCVLPSLMS